MVRASNALSPYAAAILAHHWLTGFATEGFLELRHVDDQAVDPVLAGRMRVGDGADAKIFRTLILARPLRVTDEEALVGREAVAIGEMLALGRLLPRHVADNQSTQVGHVFALGELAVDLDVVHDGVLGVLIDHALRALLKLFRVFFGPP